MGMSEPKRKVKYSIDPNALNWANGKFEEADNGV
jgi:hypothetical protein